MAPRYGPKIVKDGLVLSLDAASAKSSLKAVEVLVVAGGGGGGMDMGGGGGGGGVIYNRNFTVTSGSAVNVTIGAGGVGAPAGGTNGQPGGHQFTVSATNGSNSVFGSLTAIGGGFGASSYYGYLPNSGYGGSGGSGGGCSGYTHGGERYVDSNNTVGQGYPGGNSGNPVSGADDHYSGGGGGAGGRGTSGPNHVAPSGLRGHGGPGILYPTMSPHYWAGGGGGSGYTNLGGNGGIGGGGGGAIGVTTGGAGLNAGSPGGGGSSNSGANTPGGNAGANTGGGGGGGSHYNANNKGGEGGSGIVIVRYPGSQRAAGGTVTFVNGHTIHTFTTSGTFTPNGATGIGTIWTDSSKNGNSGILMNGVGYNSANGGSFVFDGIDDRVDISNSSTLQVNNFTLEAWVYPINNSPSGHIIRKEGSYILSHYWGEGGGAAKFGIWMQRDGGWESTHANITVPLNQWLYISGTYDNSSVIIYYNGSQVASTVKSGQTRVNTSPILINGVVSNSLTQNYRCSLVKIYNRALTAAEIKQNFDALRGRYGL